MGNGIPGYYYCEVQYVGYLYFCIQVCFFTYGYKYCRNKNFCFILLLCLLVVYYLFVLHLIDMFL